MAKIEPPSSLTTTIVRSGRASRGPRIRPVASCRKVTSPISASARVVCGRPSAAPIALETVPSMPARPRLAMTLRRSPTSYARDHQVEVADRAGGTDPQQALRWHGPADGTGHLVRRQVGLVAQQRVELTADRPVGGRPRVEPRGVARIGRRRPGDGVVDRGTAARATARRPPTSQTSTSSRARSRLIGRDSVGCPATTTRSTCSPSSPLEQQAVGPERVGAGARATRRLGEQRPLPALGEHARGRPGLVPRDDHGARTVRDLGLVVTGPRRSLDRDGRDVPPVRRHRAVRRAGR